MSPEPQWVWVSLDYATFGIAVQDGKVVDAAPIAKWCIGRDERYVADYWRRRGARFVKLSRGSITGWTSEPRNA